MSQDFFIEYPDPCPRFAGQPLPVNSCDCHAHVFEDFDAGMCLPNWAYKPRRITIGQYAGMLRALGFSRGVLVQPSVYGANNSVMLDALSSAERPTDIDWRVVVGLDGGEDESTIERLHATGVRGVRINLLYVDTTMLDLPKIQRIAEKIAPFGWHLQFLMDISRIANWVEGFKTFPVDCVIDHMGHFPARDGVQSRAFQNLLSLLEDGRTWVKLSGPHRLSSGKVFPFVDVLPIARALVAKRPDRLVFGTDWPHVSINPMPNDGDLIEELYRWVDGDQDLCRRILAENPEVLYDF